MSMPRSPRGVDSITLGTITPLGSIISRVALIHLGSFGLKMVPIFSPYNIRNDCLSSFSTGGVRLSAKLNVQRTLTKVRSCTVIIAPARYKRKKYGHYFCTLKRSLLKSSVYPGIARAIILCSFKGRNRHQAEIRHTRADTFIDTLQTSIVGSDDGGKARIVAVIEQLEELFISPG